MKHPPERDWMIVAPWWQWTDPMKVGAGQPVTPDPAKGRLSQPIFQKYDSPNLVNDFIADPQRCLKFVDDDLVHALAPSPGPSLNAAGKLFRIGANKLPKGKVNDQRYVPDGRNTRKIFLNTHKRFYLVVCEIHCDGPGFPKVAGDKVCKAGFVIRRRTHTPPSCGVDEVKPILKSLALARTRLTRVNQFAEIESLALSAATGQGHGGAAKSAKLESLLKVRASLRSLVASEKARFEEWARVHVNWQLQGWFTSPRGFDQVGCWAPMDETPADLGLESHFPLYPLKPDKNDKKHAGRFGTSYFGVLPTASHDCDRSGRARFDDQEYYEVRCWAQRHLEPHDADQPCRCPDGLFWSLPTRPYKLASHFDLTGTSNRPVTIQLPDLKALAAQAKPTLGVGLAKPEGSLGFKVKNDGSVDKTSTSRSGAPEFCFFAIPLFTIVAMFLFSLFLPVVMFLFQLWWMLALRFCIPPSLTVAGGINAELGADGRIGVKVDASIDANVEARIGANVNASINSQLDADTASALTSTYSPIALANLEIDVNSASDPTRSGSPSVIANLDYETAVAHA